MALVALLACFPALGGGAPAEIAVPTGNLQFEVDAGFAPKSLHKLRFTPGALRLSTGVSTQDGTHVPALKELAWELDRNVRFDFSGIPVCRRPRVAGPAPEESCGDTIVGQGKMEMEILFEESKSIHQVSRMMLYNGGEQGGVGTLYARAYITKPVPSSIYLQIRLQPIHSGRFRTAMVATVPKIAGGNGSITGLRMRLSRTTRHHDRTDNFVSLRCLDGRMEARTTATFSDGTRLQATSIQSPCAAR